MQGAGAAILTILVSFAIGIFIHHLGAGERKGNSLDLHIALDYVWFFVPSLVMAGIMVTAPFLLGLGDLTLKSIIFLVWLITFLWLFWILLRLYRWVKGDKDDFRLQYLSNFPKSPRDKIKSWRDWWASSRNASDRFVEKDFFVAFSKEIDSILLSEDKARWKTLPQLLEGFLSSIDKRNKIFLLVFEEGFPKILEWHYAFWNRQYSHYAKDAERIDRFEQYLFEANRLVDEIIKSITKEALTDRSAGAFSYFKNLDRHIKKHESTAIEGSQHTYHYVKHLPIYNDFLNLIPEAPDSYNIWEHFFPPHWKVTLKNFKENIITRLWLDHFMEWAKSRVWSDTDEWDKALEEASKQLFPSVDPNMWAKILTFILRPWSGDSRIQAIVEKGPRFGHIGRIITGWDEEDLSSKYTNSQDTQERETIELTSFLFSGLFTKNNIEQWLKELDSFQYETGSKQDHRRNEWRRILTLLKSEMEKVSEPQL
jgi:hypothetical protein